LEINPNDPQALKAFETMRSQQEQKDADTGVRPSGKTVLEYELPSRFPEGLSTSTEEIETAVPPEERETPPPDKDAEVHYHLGIAYKEMELFDFAITEFEVASSDPSMKFDCYIMLGSCFMDKKDYDKSIEYFRKASEIRGLSKPKLARLNYNLGLAYEAKGMVSEAIDTFGLALKLDHSLEKAQEEIEKLVRK